MSPWIWLTAAAAVGWTFGRVSSRHELLNLRLHILELQRIQNHEPCNNAIRRLKTALLEVGAAEALVTEVEDYLERQAGGP